MKYLKYVLVLLVCGASFSVVAEEGSSTMNEEELNAEPGKPAQDWRHMYFSGFSKTPAKDIDLSENLVQGLLSMIGVGAVISTGAALEPRYIINSKGLTVWLALDARVYANQPEALEKIHSGKATINIPASYLNGIFGKHINWPESMLVKHDLSLGEGHLFIIPFIVPSDGRELSNFSQSMKAPDGSLEIMKFHEFNESNPEAMLIELAGVAKFIRETEYDEK